MTTIFLIRHAENDFMRKRKLAGWLPGVHLNEHGRAQSEALVTLFEDARLAAIYSSPLERAMETAVPLARSKKLRVVPRPALGEIKYGDWQGRSLALLSHRKMWSVVQSTPSLARFPGGESFREAQARVIGELETLRGLHPSPKALIACVSHADAIKLALSHYLGQPMDLFQRLMVDPASISILMLTESRVRVVCINDTRATRAAGPG